MTTPAKDPIYGHLDFKSISPSFGAELANRHQLLEFSDSEVAALIQLAAQRGVVVLRDQHMTPQQQANFAHRLGRPLTSPVNAGKLPEELLLIQANERSKRAAGTGWHSDVSSAEKPPGLSMLRMEIVPESGGDTLFADMRQVFAALSPSMQAFLQTLHARHDPRGHYLYLSGAKRLDELPSVEHPVVRSHPLTGDRSLYVNDGFVGKIVELDNTESKVLLGMLYDRVAYAVECQCRVAWRPNTVVFWDNRIVQHHAAFDYWPATRRGYRVTIEGEVPALVEQ
jgi:taurine dioxygenase